MTIDVDIQKARAAYVELGKTLDSAEFAPPESRVWQSRAVKALHEVGDALGFEVNVDVDPAAP